MSLLIKDKDMPETCDACDFHVYHSHGEYVCVATPMFYPMNLANSKGIRKDWCPLKEAPEPCEDTVGREAVSEWLKQYGQDVLHGKYKFSLMYIWKKLMELPSVTPEPRTGRWLINSDGYYPYCSECKAEPKSGEMTNFCPSCGAKMEGE